jgi:hypothetical protein
VLHKSRSASLDIDPITRTRAAIVVGSCEQQSERRKGNRKETRTKWTDAKAKDRKRKRANCDGRKSPLLN